MDRRELLGNVSIFSSLSDDELDQLLKATTTKRLAAKETLFRKGDPGNQLYGILSGSLKITNTGTDGKDVLFSLMGPGEVVGEIALLDSEARSATATAVEATEVLTLDRRELIPFLESHPRATIGLAGVLAARVRRLSERAEDRQTMPLPRSHREEAPLPCRGTRQAPDRGRAGRSSTRSTGSRRSRGYDPRERQQAASRLGRRWDRRTQARPGRLEGSRGARRRFAELRTLSRATTPASGLRKDPTRGACRASSRRRSSRSPRTCFSCVSSVGTRWTPRGSGLLRACRSLLSSRGFPATRDRRACSRESALPSRRVDR